jgi:hypothetical protein
MLRSVTAEHKPKPSSGLGQGSRPRVAGVPHGTPAVSSGVPDEGFDANTDDDIEPANLWGRTALEPVRAQVRRYRQGRCVEERGTVRDDDARCGPECSPPE